jgi:hypothetical protein
VHLFNNTQDDKDYDYALAIVEKRLSNKNDMYRLRMEGQHVFPSISQVMQRR